MDRHKKYRGKNRIALRKKAMAYRTDRKWGEVRDWTTILRCLNGTVTEEEYCSLDGNYASYGPDDLRVVGPGFGPIRVRDSPEARARFAELVYGAELEE